MKAILTLLAACVVVAMSLSLKAQAPGTERSKGDFKKLIENSDWIQGKDGTVHFYFQRGGVGLIRGTSNGGFFYAVEAPNILKVYGEDPAKDRKAPFTLYRVNTAAMVAEPDNMASAKPGKPLRYAGPAPKDIPKPKK